MTGGNEFECAQHVYYNSLEGIPLILTVVAIYGT